MTDWFPYHIIWYVSCNCCGICVIQVKCYCADYLAQKTLQATKTTSYRKCIHKRRYLVTFIYSWKGIFLLFDPVLDLWPWRSNCGVQINQPINWVKGDLVTVRTHKHTHTHTGPIALPGPLTRYAWLKLCSDHKSNLNVTSVNEVNWD